MSRHPIPGPRVHRISSYRSILFALLAVAFLAAGCQHIAPLDTTPLDNSGMNFSAVQTLRTLGISNPEVKQIAEARQAGLSDDNCIALVRLARSRQQKFQTGDEVAQLFRAGVAESTTMQLAQLDLISSWSGEAVVMRLAGLSDQIILEEAHRHAANLPVLSGASLANFKNAGMREAMLLQLVRRGVPDNEAQNILSLRRRGWTDAQILRRYPGGR